MTKFKDRHTYLGASEVGQALGFSKWKDSSPHDLWLEKTLRAPRTAHKAIFNRGHEMEPVLARMLEGSEYGFRLYSQQAEFRKTKTPWLVSHVDGLIKEVSDPGLKLGSDVMFDEYGSYPSGPGVVEYKAPGMRVTSKVKQDGFDACYIAQLQTNIYNADVQWGVLVLLDYDQWKPLFAFMRRDDEMIEAIITRSSEFWDKVLHDLEPSVLTGEPVWLPNYAHQGPMVLADSKAMTIADRYAVADLVLNKAKTEHAEAKQAVQILMREDANSRKIEVPLHDKNLLMLATDSIVDGRETVKGKELLNWTGNLCEAVMDGEKDIFEEMAGKFVNQSQRLPLFIKRGAPYARTLIRVKEKSHE